MLSIQNISFSYLKQKTIPNFSYELQEGEVIQHSMMTKSIERAQKKVEENAFGVRKRLLEYDDVMNAQREVVYKRRRHALHGERLKVDIANMMYDTCELIVQENKGASDFKNYEFELIRYFSVTSPISESDFNKLSDMEVTGKTYKAVLAHYEEKVIRNAEEAFPVIKNVYENNNGKYERIVVPFTDGTLLVYPNQLNIVDDSKLKVIVTQNYFKGSHHLVEANYEDGKLFFANDEAIEIGNEIFLKMK